MKDNNKDYSILFVDDEQKALKYFNKAFDKEFTVLTCDNVSDAKKILDNNSSSIAILLSDQRMPDQKGTELLSYSRENHPHIIRLLTTAYSDLNDAIAAVNSGEILRYLTKPWDLNVLKTELNYAMRFFMLRHERDQLLKEKLNVKQRMVELNRVRDLIIMSSGFTHVRNPLHAISSFLLQLPLEQEPQLADLKSLDIWGLLEKEIQAQLEITNSIIRETSSKEDFKISSLEEIIKNISTDIIQNVEIKTSSSSIHFNVELIERMLIGIINALKSETQQKPHITLDADTDEIKIIINVDNNNQDESSLLGMPEELLTAFFICYHHNGNLMVDNSSNLSYEIKLPSDPKSSQLAALNDDWLEEIFYRFENWPN